MATRHLLINGERIRREVRHVNAQLPATRGSRPGTLFLTDTRLIFRSKIFLRETVYDLPLHRIADATAHSNGIGPGLLIITTTGGDRLRLKVKHNAAASIASTIHALQAPPMPRTPVREPWDATPPA